MQNSDDSIILKSYEGSSNNVVVYPYYQYNEKKYKTLLLSSYDNYIAGSHTIKKGVFYENDKIVSVTFNGKVSMATISFSIGIRDCVVEWSSASSMFTKCTNLKRVVGLENINSDDWQHMFYGCTSLTEVREIPEFVTKVSGMFSGCTSLSSFPKINEKSKISDMSYMFYGCTSLKSGTLVLPSGVSCIKEAFYECRLLGMNEDCFIYANKIENDTLFTLDNTYTFYHVAIDVSSYGGGIVNLIVKPSDVNKWESIISLNSKKIVVKTE